MEDKRRPLDPEFPIVVIGEFEFGAVRGRGFFQLLWEEMLRPALRRMNPRKRA